MAPPSTSTFRFEAYELKIRQRTLERNGKPVPLGSKAFDVLTCLVAHAGEVVTKAELLQWVWFDSRVEEGTLSQHIFALRKALGKDARFIVTIAGRGYQFTAALQELPPDTPSPAVAEKIQPPTQEVSQPLQTVLAEVISSRKAPTRKVTAAARTAIAVTVLLGLALAGLGSWHRMHRGPERAFQKVVVADISNATGDATFDTTLKRALQIDLEQSPYIEVLSEQEAASTLKLMGTKVDTPLKGDTAREVCERSNRQVLVTGSVSAIGEHYLLMLEAADCVSGRKLGAAKARADSQEAVFAALDQVTDQVRRQLGESVHSVQSFQVPIAEATTPSLDALKAYSIGTAMEAQGSAETETLPFFQQAVTLDPNFAMAYAEIGTMYYNLSEFQLAAEYYKKAFDLRGHVSARENLVLSAHYYAEGQQDLEQGIHVYELWAATYPHDWLPLLNLANEYTQIGQYGPAIDAGQRALAMEPDRPLGYSILANAYRHANRFAEAKALGLQAVQRGKDGNGLHGTLYIIAWQEKDALALARETQWEESPVAGWYGCYLRAYMAAEEGRAGRADELFAAAIEQARQSHLDESADEIVLDQAAIQIEFGMPAAARATIRQVTSAETDPVYMLTLRALLGETAPAEAYLASHDGKPGAATKPPGTLLTYLKLPRLRATLNLVQGKAADALNSLQPTEPYEMEGYEILSLHGNAALQAHRPELAATQFEKLLANQGIGYGPLYPLAHLGLARAYKQLGRVDDSRSEFRKVLAAWKDADPNLPAMQTVRAELARLP